MKHRIYWSGINVKTEEFRLLTRPTGTTGTISGDSLAECYRIDGVIGKKDQVDIVSLGRMGSFSTVNLDILVNEYRSQKYADTQKYPSTLYHYWKFHENDIREILLLLTLRSPAYVRN